MCEYNHSFVSIKYYGVKPGVDADDDESNDDKNEEDRDEVDFEK